MSLVTIFGFVYGPSTPSRSDNNGTIIKYAVIKLYIYTQCVSDSVKNIYTLYICVQYIDVSVILLDTDNYYHCYCVFVVMQVNITPRVFFLHAIPLKFSISQLQMSIGHYVLS